MACKSCGKKTGAGGERSIFLYGARVDLCSGCGGIEFSTGEGGRIEGMLMALGKPRRKDHGGHVTFHTGSNLKPGSILTDPKAPGIPAADGSIPPRLRIAKVRPLYALETIPPVSDSRGGNERKTRVRRKVSGYSVQAYGI